MNETEFKSEMLRVRTMSDVEPDRADYWQGYQRGLRRAHHGENFGTDEEHLQRLGLRLDDDPLRRSIGAGYVDGYTFGDRPLTSTEAAAVAGVKRITIQQWVVREKLTAEKHGRDLMISITDLDNMKKRGPGRPKTTKK